LSFSKIILGVILLSSIFSINLLVPAFADIQKPSTQSDNQLQDCPDCNGADDSQRPTIQLVSQFEDCPDCNGADDSQKSTTDITPSNTETPSKTPNWVKDIFGYHAQGDLSDEDLNKAVHFLMTQGIIKVI
jgi:hypothetical protein